MPLTSAQIRAGMAEALGLDLVGPYAGHPLANETLPQAPSRWYLTGFLVPFEAATEIRTDPTATEEIASGTEGGAAGVFPLVHRAFGAGAEGERAPRGHGLVG
jgi:hypothetical protein